MPTYDIKPLFKPEIDKFISNLSEEARNKVWRVVDALRLEYELTSSINYKIPYEKIARNKSSNEDARAILINLHRQGIVAVSLKLKIKYNPDEFSIQTIESNPSIYGEGLTEVRLDKDKFTYLEARLRRIVYTESKVISQIIEDSIVDDKQCIVKSRALKLIASEIDQLDVFKDGKELGNFFIACGVAKERAKSFMITVNDLMEYGIFRPIKPEDVYSAKNIKQALTSPLLRPKLKGVDRKTIIYKLLLLYSCSEERDRKILFKILENLVDPLLFEGDEEKTIIFKNKLNQYLKPAGFILKGGKIKKINSSFSLGYSENTSSQQGKRATYLDLGYDVFGNNIAVQKASEEAFEKRIKEGRDKIKAREELRIKRIEAGGGNQLVYAIQEIIKKAILNKDSFVIDLHNLGFSETMDGMGDATSLLAILKENGCISNFVRLGNDSFKIETPKIDAIKSYIKELEEGNKPKTTTKQSNNLVVDLGRDSEWKMITLTMLGNFKFKIARGFDNPYELDFQKIGYTKTTSGGQLIEKKFLKDFLLTMAISNGIYALRGLDNGKKSVVHTRKKEAKNALIESFGIKQDPFKWDPEKEEYKAEFKIIPPPELRVINGKKFITDKGVENGKFDDLNDVYGELTPKM